MNPAERRTGLRGCILSAAIIPLMVFGCGLSVFFAVSWHCTTEANRWIIDYPGSELVSEDYNWLQKWGIGTTTRVLYTPDPDGRVRAWYSAEIVTLSEKTGDNRGSGIARIPSPYITKADDGEGTLIFLSCQCAPTLKMW